MLRKGNIFMNKTLLSITVLLAGVIISATPVHAAGDQGYGVPSVPGYGAPAVPGYGAVPSNCQVIYGGGEICQKIVTFTIDKKVLPPTKGGQLVDNLSAQDAKFAPGSQVTFQITVKNTGESAIDQLDVVDTLPEFLTFVSGPGNFDTSSNTISYSIMNLEAGAENTQTIVAKVADNSALPQDKGIICVTNTVKAVEAGGSSATDASQACIERQVVGAKTFPSPEVMEAPPMEETPATGPELLSLLALIPTGAAGVFLRRKAQ